MAARPEIGYRMTLRVYSVDAQGKVTRDSGTRYIAPAEVLETRSDYPPCRCHRCRALPAAARGGR